MGVSSVPTRSTFYQSVRAQHARSLAPLSFPFFRVFLNEESFPMIIKLMRHALSGANTGEEDLKDIPDHQISIVASGIPKARETGKEIGAEFLTDAMIFRSPYKRARQTSVQVLIGAGLIKTAEDELPLRIFEDPRLREVEHGYEGHASVDAQQILRDKVGYFWYQLERGESPVQTYDRVSGFLESFMRQMERKKKDSALIISHGLIIRVLVMRYFHLTVEQFDSIRNPCNCDVITIAPKESVTDPQFTSGRWAVTGLRFKGTTEA
jgi:broad specificity phosphatase PhoE